MVKRALVSVSDKTGIVELCKKLEGCGVEILSTGGTYKALTDAGVGAVEVSSVTGFPECLDGRVKTLHPAIHAGLLAMRSNPEHMARIAELGIEPIDLVIVNLYPFKATIAKPGVALEEAIENIDIGGPTMLRSAAKNWQDVAVVTDPADYEDVLRQIEENREVDRDTKFRLCAKVFAHTAQYDAMIAEYMRKQGGDEFLPERLTMTFDKVQAMRYGENPHQRAALYSDPLPPEGSLVLAEQLQGMELSYNNIGDTDGAIDLLREFHGQIAVVGAKHANPCGVGIADSVRDAWMKAFEADPVSIYGGVVVTNQVIDGPTAKAMRKVLLDILVAPGYTDEALEILAKKKLRVLKLPGVGSPLAKDSIVAKKVYGGLLVQDMDSVLLPEGEPWKVVTDRAPTQKETDDMLLAWKIVKHTKSNAIAIAKDGQSLGIGPGQVNRIWAAQAAIERSGDKVRGAALASDAFFPFDDCAKAAADAGIAVIIQPGGSIRDEDSIRACNDAGIAMVFTGMRHFKH